MTTPTFNKFKSTTVYGVFNNLDYVDNTVQASSNIQRNLTVGGDLSCNGIIYGNKLYYNNVDISSTFFQRDISGNLVCPGATFSTTNVSGRTQITADSSTKFATTAFVKNQNYATNASVIAQVNSIYTNTPTILNPTLQNTITINYIDPNFINTNYYPLTIANTNGTLSLNTSTGSYPITLNASNLQLTTNNGTNYYDVLTTNTGAQLTGTTFTGNVSGLTATTSDNSTKFATTAFVKNQNYLTTASLSSSYALLSGATFTGNVFGLTATTSDNSNKFATTSFVKLQNYITSSALSPYAFSSALSNYALSSTLNDYALSSTLNNYALLSGTTTFSGTVNGITPATSDNSTKFATTAYVKAQNSNPVGIFYGTVAGPISCSPNVSTLFQRTFPFPSSTITQLITTVNTISTSTGTIFASGEVIAPFSTSTSTVQFNFYNPTASTINVATASVILYNPTGTGGLQNII